MILGFNSVDSSLHSDYDSLRVHTELDLLVLHPGHPGHHPICCRFRSSGQYLVHVSVNFQFTLNIFCLKFTLVVTVLSGKQITQNEVLQNG